MPPVTRGANRRLARQLREAHLRATDAEAEELDRLQRLVRCEAISIPEAHAILRQVLRDQRLRTDQAAA